MLDANGGDWKIQSRPNRVCHHAADPAGSPIPSVQMTNPHSQSTSISQGATDPNAQGSPAVVARRLIHKGRKFDFEMLTIHRPDGSHLEREIVRHPGAVVVVPLTDDGLIVLIRNFRISLSEKIWECCAGTLESGEDPAICAGRELIEETGYRAASIESIGWFYTTPGMTDERMHAFIAKGLTHIGQDLEDDESIEVETFPVAKVFDMIDRGELRDAKSMTALLVAHRRGMLSNMLQSNGVH